MIDILKTDEWTAARTDGQMDRLSDRPINKQGLGLGFNGVVIAARGACTCGGCGLAAPGGFLDAEGVSPGFRGVRREGAQT